LLGSIAGHAAAGRSRKDLKEAGEHLDEGTAGLVVVGVSESRGASGVSGTAGTDRQQGRSPAIVTRSIRRVAGQ
jgi:hypothetical protein